jgi:excisionase family DNA binding protein
MNDAIGGELESELVSVARLAQLLDCSPKTVRDWLYKDRKQLSTDPLPYYRLGGLVRFKLQEVHAWIDRRRVRVSSVACLRGPHKFGG